jgi:hypothetical protein
MKQRVVECLLWSGESHEFDALQPAASLMVSPILAPRNLESDCLRRGQPFNLPMNDLQL